MALRRGSGGVGGGEGYTTRRDKESVASNLREKLF